MTDYHVPTSCNVCRGRNQLSNKDFFGGTMHEADTVCEKCGHKDHWAHGFFKSSTKIESNCEKYTGA